MVSVEGFYGGTTLAQLKIEYLLKNKPIIHKKNLPPFLSCLLGPSRIWQTFAKQCDAIEYAQKKDRELMSFAFESCDGKRQFLVCHPVMLWFVIFSRPLEKRCTYEIIPEGKKCKLYLDIEFEYEFNPNSNGEEMLKTFLYVLQCFLQEKLNLQCDGTNFMELDSCTNSKFSRHIILNLSNVAFVNNYAVGNVIKAVCQMINDNITAGSSLYGISVKYLEELLVNDRKAKKTLFVDESVYSRNRHFRLLGSTKLHKKSPLVVSKSNKYCPSKTLEYSMFLSSLVTYFDEEHSTLIEFGATTREKNIFEKRRPKELSNFSSSSLNAFVEQVISPQGRIRDIKYFGNLIKYEISGYRYCGNIGREHKSNNISLIINLDRHYYYQTCYDADCRGYVSEPTTLPLQIILPIEDDPFLLQVAENILSDDDLIEFINGRSSEEFPWSVSSFREESSNAPRSHHEENFSDDNLVHLAYGRAAKQSTFPDMDLSDEQIIEIVDVTEAAWLLNEKEPP